MRTLEVWLGDELVGRVEESRKGGRFAYAESVVSRDAGIPLLSMALPVKARPFGESKTQNWFDGLLPEGGRRRAICRNLGVSEYDWIGLLAEIGRECAGAVKIFAEGTESLCDGTYEPIGAKELALQLSDISARMPRRGTNAFRMSLGGFQEKLCVALPELSPGAAYVDGSGALSPIGDAASTHILKPENANAYPGCAESEAWAMRVASSAARCSRTAVLRVEGAPDTLVVERYDRRREGGLATRIHQEDACQALGLSPSSKYATEEAAKENDPTYVAMAKLLWRYAGDPLEEIAELLRQMTANFVLGNWDAHAKNTSFLLESTATVAPMYDVVPIAEVEPRTRLLSLRIDGSLNPDEITRERIVAEGISWGLTPEDAEATVRSCLESLANGLDVARACYPEAAKRHEPGALRRIEALS